MLLEINWPLEFDLSFRFGTPVCSIFMPWSIFGPGVLLLVCLFRGSKSSRFVVLWPSEGGFQNFFFVALSCFHQFSVVPFFTSISLVSQLIIQLEHLSVPS